jgi:restriction system protein
MGWEAKPTRATGDGGIDIEAKIDGARVIVQCKAYSKPVSPAVARELYGTLLSSKAQSAMLASVSGFGRGVHEFIAGKPISLIDLPWILDKQQGLDFERMPTVAGHAGMARWIRRVKPDNAARVSGRRKRF